MENRGSLIAKKLAWEAAQIGKQKTYKKAEE